MRTYRFYKEDKQWFIDLKWFPKSLKHHLAMVAGADELLDKLSEGKEEITLQVSSRVFRNDSFILDRVLKFPGMFNGAVYSWFNGKIEYEIIDKNQLWLCWVTLLVFGRYPKTIYFKAL